LGTGFGFVAKGSVFDEGEVVGAFFEDFVFKDVQQIVEVDDAEFVSGGNEGDEGTGFAGFGVTEE